MAVIKNNFYECESCDKVYQYPKELNRHFNAIHEYSKERHDCNICWKKFDQETSIKTHLENDHQSCSCQNCYTSFGCKNSLGHYECGFCDQTFDEKNNLKSHTETNHEGIKKFTCQICQKVFENPGKLKTHVKAVHEGIKKHKCLLCDNKTFTHTSSLNLHIRKFHGGHKCKYCESKSFSSAQKLKSHIKKSHKKAFEEEESRLKYNCDACDEAYPSKKDLIFHYDTQHEDLKRFKCDFCLISFGKSTELKSHTKVHKKDEEVEVKLEQVE